MPPVKKPQIETSEIDPKDRDKLEKAVLSRSEAPTFADLTPERDQFRIFRDEPGPPFNNERVTLAQCRQIRKDPMVAFGLHYRKVPIARSEWHVQARDRNGPNAQVAGFVDACLRIIFTSFIFQRTLTLDFGYQAIVKQWQLSNPGGVFADRTDLDEQGFPLIKPVWDEGSIPARIWRPFQALPPEQVFPRFVESGPREGEFDGIDYEIPASRRQQRGANTRIRRGGKQSNIKEITVYNSLWATHQKWDEHGNVYGHPLVAYARDYWWDYIFAAGLQRRAMERIAIPPLKVWHPEGNIVVDEELNERARAVDVALDMGERLRSNAVAAFPSTMAETDMGEKSATRRAWDAEYMETPVQALEIFDRARNYFNIMKLRAVWVPEMAFVGRESGNSGGNIAEQMQEIFIASQELLMAEILDEVVRYMIPHILWLNFPEFINNGGKAWIVSKGFRSEDLEIYQQLIQLLGQSNPTLLADVDTRELLTRAQLPLRDPAELAAERKALTDQGIRSLPPLVTPAPGQVGVIANPNVNRGFTAGGSVPEPATVGAGFSWGGSADNVWMGHNVPYLYVNGPEEIKIEMAEGDVDNFLSGLPGSKHYSDKSIRAMAVQIRRLWFSHFRRLYPDLARYINKLENVEFSDEKIEFKFGEDGLIELANGGRQRFISQSRAEKAAKKIMKEFSISSGVLKELGDRTRIIMRKMINRTINLEAKNTGVRPEIDEDIIESFLDEQISRLTKFSHQTFTDEARQHLINEIRDGKTPGDIADGLVSRFENMPFSKADRIGRSETRDIVNAGTLITGQGANIRYVRMRDGEEFDDKCADRNGKLATIREAWRAMRDEHPYGTLGFELVPRADFSIRWTDELPGETVEGQVGLFDDESSTVYVANGIDDEAFDQFVYEVVEYMMSTNGRH